MSKKLQHNGLWESSRMMLTQHREAIKIQQNEEKRLVQPKIDEQEAHAMAAALMQSQIYNQKIEITIFGEYQFRKLTGRVTSSHQRDAFRLMIDDANPENEWIKFRDLTKVEIIENNFFFE